MASKEDSELVKKYAGLSKPVIKPPVIPPELLPTQAGKDEAQRQFRNGGPASFGDKLYGAFGEAFPQTAVALGGADELTRRANIDSANPTRLPIRPTDASPQSSLVTTQATEQATPSGFSQRSLNNLPVTVLSKPTGYDSLEGRGYKGNGIEAIGIAPIGRQGAFSGASTDAEAARNLQARFEQDEAAKGIAAGYDRAVERLRDLRAEKLGISRNDLDVYEGRAKAPEEQPAQQNPFALPGDKYGDDVFRKNALLSTINDSRASRSERKAAADTYNTFIESGREQQPQRGQPGSSINPLDLQRFLLDQSKFDYQQNLDKGRLGIEAGTLRNKQAGTELDQQKYSDERRKAFIDNFSYPDENAPREQLGALTLQLADSTGGVIPPEIMVGYIQKAAEEAGVDWEDAPPKSLTALGKRAMELATKDFQ